MVLTTIRRMLKDPFDFARAAVLTVFLMFAVSALLQDPGILVDSQLAQVPSSIITPSLAEIGHADIYGINRQVASHVSAATKAGILISPNSELQNLLAKRKGQMLLLAKTNPRLFLALTLPASVRSKLPSAYKDFIEQPLSGDAVIDVLHIDDFTNPANSRFDYYLRVPRRAPITPLGESSARGTSSDRLNFYPTSPLTVRSNTKVRLSGGVRLGMVAVADTTQNVTIVSEPPTEAIGDQKTLVLLAKFKNSPLNPFIKEAEADELVFKSQFQNFMKEQSYGKVSFSGDVYGWYTVPRDGGGEVCEAISQDDIGIIVKAYNIDLSKYGRLVVLLSEDQGYGGCSTVGKFNAYINGKVYVLSLAYVGTKPVALFDPPPFLWTTLDLILSHEVGHGLGLWHANALDCGRDSIYGICSHIEYGNLFDIMGDDRFSLHSNAFYKKILGWLTASDIIEIKSPGRYSLSNLESRTGKRLALIYPQNESKPAYAVELRAGLGFNSRLLQKDYLKSNVGGLLVNRVSDNTTRLVDASPTDAIWHLDMQDSTIPQGSALKDLGRGITILPLGQATSSSAMFDVKFTAPVCIPQSPKTFNPWISRENIAGATGFFSIEVWNQDPSICGSSEFELALTLPAGWRLISAVADYRETIASDAYGSLSAYFEIPKDTPAGAYIVPFTVVNRKSGLITASRTLVSVKIPPAIPAITVITPTTGKIGTVVTLTVSGFDTTQPMYINITEFFKTAGLQIPPSGHTSSTVAFSFPARLDICDTSGCNTKPTLPALYRISVLPSNALETNAVYFEVLAPVLSIAPPRITVYSGDRVTLNFTEPPNVIARKLFVSCPVGLTAVGVCNVWKTFSGPVSQYIFAITNTTTAGKNAVPNFYVYTSDRPDFAKGVSSEITVLPKK